MLSVFKLPNVIPPENVRRDFANTLEGHKIANFQYFEVWFFCKHP